MSHTLQLEGQESFHKGVAIFCCVWKGRELEDNSPFLAKEVGLFPGLFVWNLMENSATTKVFGPCCFHDMFSWQGSHSMVLAPPGWVSKSVDGKHWLSAYWVPDNIRMIGIQVRQGSCT